jgi:hypothetical protein
LNLQSSDDRIGVTRMIVSPGGPTATATERAYAAALAVPAKVAVVAVRVRDWAGSWSGWKTITSPRASTLTMSAPITVLPGHTAVLTGGLTRTTPRAAVPAAPLVLQRLISGTWRSVTAVPTGPKLRHHRADAVLAELALLDQPDRVPLERQQPGAGEGRRGRLGFRLPHEEGPAIRRVGDSPEGGGTHCKTRDADEERRRVRAENHDRLTPRRMRRPGSPGRRSGHPSIANRRLGCEAWQLLRDTPSRRRTAEKGL